MNRRTFLSGAAMSPFAMRLAQAGEPTVGWLPRGDDKVLVVLELVGGNDGLNTVLPVEDAAFARARPRLSVVRKGAHALERGLALHPALGKLHRRTKSGGLAVVTGVGYPEPDRSHFRSRDIWHTADPTHQKVENDTTGWLGRAADQLAAAGAGVPAAAVGGLEVPLALRARRVTVPSLERVEDFQWLAAGGSGPVARGAAVRGVVGDVERSAKSSDLARFVGEVARSGAALADDLQQALKRYTPRAEYPATKLARDLQLTAQLAVAGFGTRLVHVALTGFDTHARQLPTHAGLLRQLDGALDAFLADLGKHGFGDRVTVLVHSEFGRRVRENASQGTDHGAAGPVFVAGGAVRGGLIGAVPDLGDLDDGDLVAEVDFRRVYTSLLTWLGADSQAVLGRAFEPLALFAK
ncbi:MAG: DUF1501 domain-containing protein [bacterium]|nr:DUF1501 domain-containing protein [bacterium]